MYTVGAILNKMVWFYHKIHSPKYVFFSLATQRSECEFSGASSMLSPLSQIGIFLMVEGQGGNSHVASADISVSRVAIVLRPQTSTLITSTLIPYLGMKCPNQITTDIPPWRYINGACHPIEEYNYLPTPSSIMVVGNLNDFEDKSSYDVLYDTISKLGRLFALPTTEELRACWELCRLHNNIGFWVVWLPTGEPGSGLRFRSTIGSLSSFLSMVNCYGIPRADRDHCYWCTYPCSTLRAIMLRN